MDPGYWSQPVKCSWHITVCRKEGVLLTGGLNGDLGFWSHPVKCSWHRTVYRREGVLVTGRLEMGTLACGLSLGSVPECW